MSQPVVIKGNKHGIIVVLDAEAEFKDLKVQIEEKFKASAKFFGSADMALGFEGRVLSDEQQREVLDIIANVSQLNIICIIDHDEAQDAVFKAAIDQTQNCIMNLIPWGGPTARVMSVMQFCRMMRVAR